jgi:ribosomal protein S18 acetylase RimI-like enzyme
MDFAIVPYSQEHFDGVEALWQAVFPGDAPRHAARIVIPPKLALQPDLLLVAVEDGEVIGSVMAGYDGYRGWINRLAVLSSHRRKGLGRALMAEAEKRLLALGCAKINLQVIVPNADVVGFYRRLGYAVEERISMSKQIKQL